MARGKAAFAEHHNALMGCVRLPSRSTQQQTVPVPVIRAILLATTLMLALQHNFKQHLPKNQLEEPPHAMSQIITC